MCVFRSWSKLWYRSDNYSNGSPKKENTFTLLLYDSLSGAQINFGIASTVCFCASKDKHKNTLFSFLLQRWALAENRTRIEDANMEANIGLTSWMAKALPQYRDETKRETEWHNLSCFGPLVAIEVQCCLCSSCCCCHINRSWAWAQIVPILCGLQ